VPGPNCAAVVVGDWANATAAKVAIASARVTMATILECRNKALNAVLGKCGFGLEVFGGKRFPEWKFLLLLAFASAPFDFQKVQFCDEGKR
jgi:hypothetical protein